MHDAKGGSQLKTVKGHAACRNGGGGRGDAATQVACERPMNGL